MGATHAPRPVTLPHSKHVVKCRFKEVVQEGSSLLLLWRVSLSVDVESFWWMVGSSKRGAILREERRRRLQRPMYTS